MGGRQLLEEDAGWALLRRAREVHVSMVVDGRPIVRAMHGVVHGGRLWLHGTPRGHVSRAVDGPVQVLAEEIVARIPSWMRDPARACPATTYYRSVLLDGVLRTEPWPSERAAALQAMMEVLQPEGRHEPIVADHALYHAAVRGLGVWSVEPTALSAVHKLGQDQSVAHIVGILRGLWRRGDPGDLAAIEQIVEAHPERPSWWELPDGLRARVWPSEAHVQQATELVQRRYWNTDQPPEALARAVRHSAWVGIERDGRLVATARGISDRAKRGWIYDVAVSDELQRQGLGHHLLVLLLDHPDLRETQLSLGTRDAVAFYEKFGFREAFTEWRDGHPSTLMRKPRPST
jgi:nitroimidazol reductase NimA-like FMN-containing flavoprotein (pyridoxamine 5'-phosphate oxidase superfamily)/ribosomal protein S18 acetylase RimI-like enzyme